MKPILWRLTAASAGVLVALSMNVGSAGASSSEGHARPEPGPVQVADQSAHTDQNADSYATSEQFLPINANVPVQILSLGSNGGKTTQSNNSTATSTAQNQAGTSQSIHQSQSTPKPEGPKPHDGGWKPEGHKGHKPKGHKPEGPKGRGRTCHRPEGPKGREPKGPEGHGPKAPEGPAPAFQGASQQARTDQNADSSAKSEQFLPINANVPVQILSLGSNGGPTTQSNNSTATSKAANEAWTDQSAGQHQSAGPAPAFQGASQSASTDQSAHSSATSKQIAPVNANVPVQILSLGSNGGPTTQSNNSTATSSATNQAGTSQVIGQVQGIAGGLIG